MGGSEGGLCKQACIWQRPGPHCRRAQAGGRWGVGHPQVAGQRRLQGGPLRMREETIQGGVGHSCWRGVEGPPQPARVQVVRRR